jgi:polyisoprenyl-phosphate glycosyltransferase
MIRGLEIKPSPDAPPVIILLPSYDDWDSAAILIARIHDKLEGTPTPVEYLLVDDGSTIPPPAEIIVNREELPKVSVLRLRRNVGHQRAIAIGLSWVHVNCPCRGVLVMDADGEDTPEGVLALLEAFTKNGMTKAVFAARARRTEGLMFRVLYRCYKLVHRVLTGRSVRVGNFSVMPSGHVRRLVAVSELWSHYPAAVFKAALPNESVPVDRGHRIAGASKMNLVSLMAHGLSASAVFAEVMALRLLLATFGLACLALCGVIAVLLVRFGTDLAIPGWATTTTGVLIIIFFQAFLMATVFVFVMLHGRSALGFLPIRDYAYFVDEVQTLPVRSQQLQSARVRSASAPRAHTS